jgi:hypothetical protein
MSQPFLHLGDVGLMGEGVGSGGCPQGVYTKVWDNCKQANLAGIAPHNILIDRDRMQGFGECLGPVVLDGPEQRPVPVALVPRGFQIGPTGGSVK